MHKEFGRAKINVFQVRLIAVAMALVFVLVPASIAAGSQCNIEDRESALQVTRDAPLITQVTETSSRAAGWWNGAWIYRTPVDVRETSGTGIQGAPIQVSVDFPSGVVKSAVKEVRIVNPGGSEIPSEVLSEECGGGSCSNALIVFSISVAASQTVTYHVYYGNPAAIQPTYNYDPYPYDESFSTSVTPSSNWTTGGSPSGWTRDTSTYNSTPASAKSGMVNYQNNYIQYVINVGYDFTFSFRYKYNVESCCDDFYYSIDSQQIFNKYGSGTSWTSQQNQQQKGTHTFRWWVTSDYSVTYDGAWIDDIEVRPDLSSIDITVQPYEIGVDLEVVDGEVTIDPDPASVGDDIDLSVPVYNVLALEASGTVVFSYSQDQVDYTQIDTTPITVPTGQTQTATVQWTPDVGGDLWIKVELIDVTPGDADADNSISETKIHINRYPVVKTPDTQSTYQDQVFTFTIEASDPDGNKMTYADDTDLFDIDDQTGKINVVPNNDQVGFYKINISVTDTVGAITGVVMELNVKNTNDPPVMEDILPQTAYQDSEFSYQVVASDIDTQYGDILMFSTDTAWVGIDITTGLIKFTPTNERVGVHTVKVTVSDTKAATASKTFQLTIENVNDPPSLIKMRDLQATEDVPFTYQVKATDPDLDHGDWLTFGDDSDIFDIDEDTGDIEFTPLNEDVGSHDVTIWVEDDFGERDEVTIKLTIQNEPDEPVLDLILDIEIEEDEEWFHTFTAKDDDLIHGDKITFHDDTTLFDISSDGKVSWTPTNADVGTYDVTISVEDSTYLSDFHTFKLTVLNINDPPEHVSIIAPSDGSKYKEDESITFIGEGEDIDPDDELDFKWLCDNKEFGTGEEYTTKDLPAGEHTITFVVTDGDAEVKKSMTIEIEPTLTGSSSAILGVPLIVWVIIIVIICCVIGGAVYMARKKPKEEQVTEIPVATPEAQPLPPGPDQPQALPPPDQQALVAQPVDGYDDGYGQQDGYYQEQTGYDQAQVATAQAKPVPPPPPPDFGSDPYADMNFEQDYATVEQEIKQKESSGQDMSRSRRYLSLAKSFASKGAYDKANTYLTKARNGRS